MKKKVKCATQINRKLLQKVQLIRVTEDVFCIRTFILDRDTLGTSYLKSYLKKDSIETVISLYLRYFLETDTMKLEW